MSARRDAIVIGVGGVGSAATYHLANRGVDVLGLERFDIPHSMGSSHGITRIIRRGQYEGPEYVPLIDRAYELWRELESRTGRDLLYVTGGIDAGPPTSEIVTESIRSCRVHGIDHEVLGASAVNDRFPGYELPSDHRAVYQPASGFLVPEQCIIAHVEAAQAAGADVHAREPVEDVQPLADGGAQVTTRYATYETDHVVLTAGAWTASFLPELTSVVVPERQVLMWFHPHVPEWFDPDSFPVFVHATRDAHYYGVPRFDVPGFKVGKFNHLEETADPDDLDAPRREDERVLRAYAERCFPQGAGPTMRLSTCMFTNTPDGDFVLDTVPDHPQIAVGAGFSGHGFKFACVSGEILADLVVDGTTDHPIGRFAIDRF